MSSEVLGENEWPCKLTTTLAHFAETFSFFYLIIVASSLRLLAASKFEAVNKAILSLGFVVTVVTTVSWAMVMKFTFNFYCWLLDSEHTQHWINNGPRLVLLSVAVLYLIKALLVKNESIKTRKPVHDAK